MYIGLGIVLLVLGMILEFDVVTVDIKYVNDNALGMILIIGGCSRDRALPGRERPLSPSQGR